MTSRNRIGLAASLVLGTLALAAVAAPASAAWWGDGRWHEDTRWRNNNSYYYGYHYREPPVIYCDAVQLRLRRAAGGLRQHARLLDQHPAVVQMTTRNGGQQCPPFFVALFTTMTATIVGRHEQAHTSDRRERPCRLGRCRPCGPLPGQVPVPAHQARHSLPAGRSDRHAGPATMARSSRRSSASRS